MWTGRHEAQLTIDGAGGDPELVSRLDSVLDKLLDAGASHVVVDLHRLTGEDHAVLELLAATCHRLWDRGGVLEVHGLRDRLLSRPEVSSFPEVFGELQHQGGLA